MIISKNKKTLIILSILLTSVFQVINLGYASEPFYTLTSSNLGTSVIGDCGGRSDVVNITAPGQAVWNSTKQSGENVNEGRIEIPLPDGFTLGDLVSISWDVYTIMGYPPHIDLILDMDNSGDFDNGKKDLVTGETLPGIDDVLIFEFAYQPYNESATSYKHTDSDHPYGHYDPASQSQFYNPSYNEWLQTFQNSSVETSTIEINNASIGWLYSGLPGPYDGGYFGKLSDFKDGTVKKIGGTTSANVTSDTVVLALQIEVDNWLGAANASVDNIKVVGKPFISIISPQPKTYGAGDIPLQIEAIDVMEIESINYTLIKTRVSTPLLINQSYTSPTTLNGLNEGEYTLQVVATNENEISARKSVTFNVSEQVSVDIHPETLNLRSKGRWITVKITLPEDVIEQFEINMVHLIVDGETLEPEWGRIDEEDYSVMLKFSRASLIEILESIIPESSSEETSLDMNVTVRVVIELPGGETYEHNDILRIINPGKGNINAYQLLNRGQTRKQGQSQNKGQGPKNGKPGKGPKGKK